MHRGGTTWLGKQVEKLTGFHYVREPLFFSQQKIKQGSPVRYWYPYLTVNASRSKIEATEKYFNRVHSASKSNSLLWKDPFAVLSLPYFLEHCNFPRVYVSIRRPLAIINSISLQNGRRKL